MEGKASASFHLEFRSKKSSSKLGDFGIVNIVQESTPNLPEEQPIISSHPSTTTATEQLAEQTSQMLDDLRKSHYFSLKFSFQQICFLQAPTRVGERLIKSKIIPEQARALASALKQAVVKPLKRTMKRKKSLDVSTHEQQLLSSHLPIAQSLSNPPSTFLTNSDHHLNELSVDSYESTSLMALTPPPAKPPRQNDESGSSSSIEIHSPPAKPPRHFSVYKTAEELNALRRTTNDQFVRIQTSDSLKNVVTFTVEPIRIAVKTDVPLQSESLDEQPVGITTISSSTSQQDQIVSYATNLTDQIVDDMKKQMNKSSRERLFNKLSQLEQQQQQQEEQTVQTSRDISSSFPPPMVTTHISPNHSTKRPLMFLPFDSNTHFIPINKRSPLLEIVTIKPTPILTTSITVTSSTSSSSLASSTITPGTNSADDFNSTEILSSKDLQIQKKRMSIDSHDLTSYDNTITSGNDTPVRSLHSDYDNFRGSYGSLIDDNQTPRLPSPSTVSSSMTTIYESLDNFPSSSSTTTSRTYVSAVSTFNNTDGTRTPSQRINSDLSDEDLLERSSQGRTSEREKHESVHISSPLWHVIDLPSYSFPQQLACAQISLLTEIIDLSIFLSNRYIYSFNANNRDY